MTSPFGWRIHPIYDYRLAARRHRLRAACGAPIDAAGIGTVISEYFQTAWGNRLYPRPRVRVNGNNMTVIYNHLSGYRVGTGDQVTRGETVGYAGTTGWSTGCHLHFTVLLNGNPVTHELIEPSL